MDALQIKNSVLALGAAVGAVVSRGLGGWDAAMRVLVAMMAADYATGVLLALIWHKSRKSSTGTLDSKAGFKGICKKCVILVLVWLGVLLDKTMGTEYIRMAVILFFAGNEGLSLLENLGLMGIPFPAFLRRALEALREQGDGGEP